MSVYVFLCVYVCLSVMIATMFGVSIFMCLYMLKMFFYTVSAGNLNVLEMCVRTCVCSVLSVHEGLMVSDGLTIKRLSL